jgi:hypothetical protein
MLVERPLASAFGLLGLACLALWPLFHSRTAILLVQFGIGTSYCIHYLLLEAWTGVGITALGAAQTLATMFFCGHPRLRAAALAFLPLPTVIAGVTWIGLPSLFAAVALTLMMIGRMQLDELRMRALLLTAIPLSMVYDFAVGSLPALAGSTIAMAIGLTMLAHDLALRRDAGRARAPLAVRTCLINGITFAAEPVRVFPTNVFTSFLRSSRTEITRAPHALR